MTDRQDTTLGKYRLRDRLGEGGMGTVYRGHDAMLDRDVAIKLLRPDLVSQQSLVDRFRTEAIALARLAHPNIATLYGLERDGDEFYMVMEFLHGETLEALVQREGRLSWRRAAEICAQVAEALDHAHDHGVVHRDIKPANIMIGPAGSVKVMDFGIARMAGSSRQTHHGHTVGTPAYMAPEQLRGEDCDGRTDLYALGAVFYELITGKVAFEADSDYKLMMQQLNDPPPAPSASQPDIPALVDQAVLRAMAKQPADRFASAAAMRNALVEAAASVVIPSSGAPPATRLARSAPAAGRSVGDPTAASAAHVPVTAEMAAPEPENINRRRLWLDWRPWAGFAGLALSLALLLRPPASKDPAQIPPDTAPVVASAQATTPPPGGGTPSRSPVEAARFITPPAAPSSPRPIPPVSRPEPRPAPDRGDNTPPPPPAPPTPAARAAADADRAEQQIGRAIDAWFTGLARKSAPGLSGTLGGQSAATLVREGRLQIDRHHAPSIVISGSRSTATVRVDLQIRSSFGASKELAGQFRFDLRQSDDDSWRVTGVRVAD